jgi:hypothetical protein
MIKFATIIDLKGERIGRLLARNFIRSIYHPLRFNVGEIWIENDLKVGYN